MNNTKFKVFLSGGGLKGAYQYGFFKKLYKLYPDITIEKVYAASVGALNAAPIVVKKMELLDEFWNNNKNPCENIIQNWYDIETYPKKALKNIYYHQALYKDIREDKIIKVWNQFDTEDIIQINKKLTIVAYDKINKIPAYLKTTNITNFSTNIKASINMPFLFSNFKTYSLSDGFVVPIETVIEHENKLNDSGEDNWIIIDLSKYKKSFSIIEPLNLKSNEIHNLITLGEKDAIKFVKYYKK